MADKTGKPSQCAVCGATGVPLHRAHIVPKFIGGVNTLRNLLLLCPNCHAEMDRGQIREFEFQAVLLQLMRLSGKFDEGRISEEAALGNATGVRVDIAATDKTTGDKVLIECKSSSALNARRMRELLVDLNLYRSLDPAARVVLAIPSRLSPTDGHALIRSGFEVWDIDEIARIFHDQLKQVTHPVLRPMLLGVAALHSEPLIHTVEARLIEELLECPPGQQAWREYQRLITRILERLFVPPLAPPLSEESDSCGRNRRDIILPNYAESGFWAFLRSRYAADFIVADAKNWVDEIGKDEALQVLNYLKEDGAGLFGLLIGRKNASEACRHALVDHWTRHGKLIVCLSDDDVAQMLRLKEGGGSPETVIRQAIEDFRLSL